MSEQEARDAVQLAVQLSIDKLMKAQRYHGGRPEYARYFADKVVDQLKLSGITLFRLPPQSNHSTPTIK